MITEEAKTMLTKSYLIKNAEIVAAALEQPFAMIMGTEPRYFVKLVLTDEDAEHIKGLVKEVAEEAFGAGSKGILGYSKARHVGYDGVGAPHRATALSYTPPKITGLPNSKGMKLNLIKRADVRIAIFACANGYGKAVGLALKEIIFNHQPQPTGEQKCL